MLAYSPYPHDLWRLQGEEAQEAEAEVEGATIMSKRNAGAATRRGLRVGQCHPLLKKHNV